MDWLGSILDQIHELRCPTCTARLENGTVRGVASEDQRVLVQISCSACGENSIAVIERIADGTPVERPITEDEVLDAHDFLASFDGSIESVLGHAA